MLNLHANFDELIADQYADPIFQFMHNYKRFLKPAGMDYLNLTRAGEISFIPPNRCEEGVDPWESDKRQIISAGRGLRKIVAPLEFTDPQIEQAAAKIKAATDIGNFEIVYGDEIIALYQRDAIVGVTSCMVGEDAKIRFYAENAPAVGLLVARDSAGNPLGRAIIWNTNKGYFVDYVYASSTAVQKQFDRWVKENGEYTYTRSSYDRTKDSAFAVMPNYWPDRNGWPSLDTTSRNDALRLIQIGPNSPNAFEVASYMGEKLGMEDFKNIPPTVLEFFRKAAA